MVYYNEYTAKGLHGCIIMGLPMALAVWLRNTFNTLLSTPHKQVQWPAFK